MVRIRMLLPARTGEALILLPEYTYEAGHESIPFERPGGKAQLYENRKEESLWNDVPVY
jgi:hypothetical protein